MTIFRASTLAFKMAASASDGGLMPFHSVEVDLGESFSVGLAVTSRDNSRLATLDVRHFDISDEVYSLPSTPTEVGSTGGPVWVQQIKPGMWSLQAGGTGIGVRYPHGLSATALRLSPKPF